jgi:acetylornithine deacetylase
VVFEADPDSAQYTDALFDPPITTVNVGVIEGGSAKNIVPGKCWFLVEWRPIPADSPRGVLAQLEWISDGLRIEEPRAKIRVEPLRAERGFASAGEGPLQLKLKQIAEAMGRPFAPIGISFGSEATRLSEVAHEIVVMGPGDMHTAHSDRECVPTAELDEWTRTLRALLSAKV